MRIQESTFQRNKAVLNRDYYRAMIQLLNQRGIKEDAIPSHLKPSEDDDRISPLQFRDLILISMELSGDPSLGFYFGRSWDVATLGVFGQAISSSSTLGEALVHLLRYYAFSGVSMRVDLHADGPDFIVTLEHLYGEETPADVVRFFVESTFSSWDMVARTLVDEDFACKAVYLPYPQPAYVELYKEMFDGEIHFDSDHSQLRIAKDIFNIPLPSANDTLHEFSQGYSENQLIDVVRRMRSLPGCIKHLLQNTHGSFPTLDDMAGCLHISPRSLCRRLREEETSYQALLNEVRRERAIDYLCHKQWSVEKVASHLGFSDASNFRRAFKQWTGMTPAAMRSQYKIEQDAV